MAPTDAEARKALHDAAGSPRLAGTDGPSGGARHGGDARHRRGIAIDLARQGWAVAVTFRTDPRAAEATRAAIESRASPRSPSRRDLAEASEARALVARVETDWGRLDVLVHGAGPYTMDRSWRRRRSGGGDVPPESRSAPLPRPGRCAWDERRGGGAGSWGSASRRPTGSRPSPNVTAYYIAKAGLLVLVRSLAKVLAADSIT